MPLPNAPEFNMSSHAEDMMLSICHCMHSCHEITVTNPLANDTSNVKLLKLNHVFIRSTIEAMSKVVTFDNQRCVWGGGWGWGWGGANRLRTDRDPWINAGTTQKNGPKTWITHSWSNTNKYYKECKMGRSVLSSIRKVNGSTLCSVTMGWRRTISREKSVT